MTERVSVQKNVPRGTFFLCRVVKNGVWSGVGGFDAGKLVKPPESMEMPVSSSSRGKYKVGNSVRFIPYGTVYWN
jgi:hypothetical protein